MQERQYSIVNDDCRNRLCKLHDNSIDLILTDPPYNIAKYSTGNIALPGREALNNDIASWDMVDIDPREFIDEFKRILKPDGNIFIFTSYNLIGKCSACCSLFMCAKNKLSFSIVYYRYQQNI